MKIEILGSLFAIDGRPSAARQMVFLSRRLLAAGCLAVVASVNSPAASWSLAGNLGAHDPSIIREGATWWCLATGAGLPIKSSADGLNWTQRTPRFSAELPWWRTYAPNMGVLDVWAPDLHQFGGRVWCYYSVSEFGRNNSAIGLTSCTSLAAGDWRDDGLVISSRSGVDAFNAIDPSLTTDTAGNPWLVFGSWFDGIHVVQLDPNTMKPAGPVYSLAARANGIEGANIVFANGYFYLFVSIDQCCLGVSSTYKIAYGRSTDITGPYLDKNNVPMVGGGGTVLDAGDSRWKGPGGQSVIQNGSAWIIAFHAYDANNNGNPTLQISDLFWDSGNWPTFFGRGVVVSTVAGQAGATGGADGTGPAARFNYPADAAVDSAGIIYVADTDNHTIRKVTPAGVVTTLAGQAGVSGSADGAGTAARFKRPAGVTVDGAGNVYVADTDNDTIRKITPAGVVSTLAGTAGVGGSTDGLGPAASFNGPSGIAADTAGNLYVADTLNHTIRSITPDGNVTTLAGLPGASGSANGTGSAARFQGPQGLALDGAGNLYVADTNNDIVRKIVLSSGTVTTVAGQAGASGAVDGAGSTARFFNPSGVAVDAAGNLYVADTDNITIRQISPSGNVVTIAGQAGTIGSADGVDGATRVNLPTGVAVDSAGNIYVADTNNHTIRLAIFSTAPGITTQPQSQTVTAGANVQFSVTAAGKPAPAYQWYFNSTAISGATSSSYGLTNVQTASAGNYTVTVTNAAGSATSSQATLTVNAAATPPPSSGGGGGGGGAMNMWFGAGLALLGAARWLRLGASGWKTFAWLLLPAAVLVAAPAEPAPDAVALLARLGKRETPVRVHDPSTIIKCKDEYWVFATGRGVISLHSKNLAHWEQGPAVFPKPPAWITDVVPTQKGLFWAPDVLWHGGRYLLYYAVSAPGKRTSAIALATNPTLDPADSAYHWTDAGIVVQTNESDNFNAIDPSIFRDTDGKLWMAFGSFWSGIKLLQLDATTGRRLAPDSPIHSLAWHESIEASCLYRHGDYYYLFVNWGLCCRGMNSTYEIRIGRSRLITGPYIDREGRDLLHDGGSVFMAIDGPFIGPGHVGILTRDGGDWVSVHFYDGTRKGAPTLAIRPLTWSADGWPVAGDNSAGS